MKTTGQTASVPEPIVEKLQRLIRRVRLVKLIRGVLAVAAVAVGSLLAVMAVNESIPTFAAWPGWVLTSSAFVLTLVAALVFLVRPLMRSFTLPGIARVIEQRRPELQERLSSVVELLTSKDAPELRGSEALINALAREAVVDSAKVAPRREISMRPLRPFIAAAGATLTILALLLVIWPSPTARALTRAVLPYVKLGNAFSAQLTVTPGDTTVVQGSPLEVTVLVANARVGSAELQLIAGDGSQSTHRMMMLPDYKGGLPRFQFTCPPLERSYRYRIEASPAISREYRVTVVPRPTIERIDVRYDFPAYMNLQGRTDLDASGDIREKVGVNAKVTVQTNTRLVSGELTLAGRTKPVKIDIDSDGRSVCTFEIRMTDGLKGDWRLKLIDAYGFTNRLDRHLVEAIADTPPLVKIVNIPSEPLKLRPSDRLPVIYAIEDDFGIRDVQFLLTADGRKLPPVTVSISQEGPARRKRIAGKVILDLGRADLKGAGRLTFQLRAEDVLPGEMKGPQFGFSEIYEVEFDSRAVSYPEQVLLAEELLIREVLKKVLKDLRAAKIDSNQLEKLIPKLPKLTGGITERIDRMRKLISSSDASVRDLADQIAVGTYRKLAVKLTDLADKHISVAENYAGRIVLTDSQKQRVKLADETDYQIGRAIDLLEEHIEALGDTTDAIQRAIELEDLAARQKELAEIRDAMKADDAAGKAELSDAQWKSEQKKVARGIGELIREDPKARSDQAAKDNETARDLAGEARGLSKEQSGVARGVERADKFAALDAEARKLAAEQKALAASTASEKAAVEESKKMQQASEDILAGKLSQAVKKQSASETALKKNSGQIQQQSIQLRKSLSSLASQAGQIAVRQRRVADSAAKAKGDPAKLPAIQKQLKAATDTAQQLARQVKPLADRQAKISAERKQLTRQVSEVGKRRRELDKRAADIAARRKELARQQADAKNDQKKLAELNRQKEQLDKQASDLSAQIKSLASRTVALAKHKGQLDTQASDLAKKQSALKRASEHSSKRRSELARREKLAKPNPSLIAALANRQRQLAQQAKQLSRQAAGVPAAAQIVKRHDPTQEMEQAAQAMLKRQPLQAVEASGKAREKADQLAAALRKEEQQQAKRTTASLKQARTMVDLARRQLQLRRKTEDLNRRRAALRRDHELLELARLRKAQSQLAREVGKLVDEIKENEPQADRIDTKAAKASREAAADLQQSKVAQAAEKADEASEALGEIARRIGSGTAPKTAPKGGSAEVQGSTQQEPDQLVASDSPAGKRQKMGERAADLAKRQGRLAGQIKALAEEKPVELAASRQQDIAERTQSLAEATELVRAHAEDLLPNSAARAEAQKASGEVAKAIASQQQARRAMQSGKLRRAIPSQQKSAEALGRAAGALDKLGKVLAEEAGRDAPDKGEGEDLGEAYEAASEAAITGKPSDAALAAKLLARLATKAAGRLEQMGVKLSEGMTLQPMESLESLSGTDLMPVDLSAAQLEKLGISIGDWARLPGDLKNQILQASSSQGLAEYRALIKRYFIAIARRGGRKTDGKNK